MPGETAGRIVRLDHAIADRRNILFVDWMIGNACNYACSYCPPSLHDGSRRWISHETIAAFTKRLVTLAEEQKKIVYIQLAGGEVTAIPYFINTLECLKEAGARTLIISNATRDIAWWKRAAAALDEVVLTFHPEQAELAHFTAVANVASAQIRTHINVAAPPDHFDKSLAAARHIAEQCRDVTITLKPMLIGFGHELYPYTAEQLRTLREQVFRAELTRPLRGARGTMVATYEDGSSREVEASTLVVEGLNRWQMWECDIGIELLCIKHSGEIHRGECGVGGEIGHVQQWQEFVLPAAGITCTKPSCSCLLDIMTSRREHAVHAVELRRAQRGQRSVAITPE